MNTSTTTEYHDKFDYYCAITDTDHMFDTVGELHDHLKATYKNDQHAMQALQDFKHGAISAADEFMAIDIDNYIAGL